MKIIYNKIIPFGKRFYAINLFGVLFAKGSCDNVILNHEKIHTAQMRELLYVFFYLAYILEWIIRLLSTRNFFTAYKSISFEREAYSFERDMQYLSKRKHYSFLKYFNSEKITR